MILVVDIPNQKHSAYMYHNILEYGGKAVFFQAWRFPSEIQMTFNHQAPTTGTLKLSPDQPAVSLSDIKAVYFPQTLELVQLENVVIEDPYLKESAWREVKSAMGSLFRNMDCLWVDAIDTFEQHMYKLHQLQILDQVGIRVPDTIVSNDPDEIRAFYEKHNKQVIFKPVWFGAYANRLKDTDFQPERLKTLASAPVAFQEFIPGTDILVYLVKDEPFASEMTGDSDDFRKAQQVKFKPINLPEQVTEDCIKLARTLNMNFAAIDLRRTPDGEYVYFEGNPSPAFMHFENYTGYPVCDRLVKLLMSAN